MNSDAKKILAAAIRAARTVDPDLPADVLALISGEKSDQQKKDMLLWSQAETARALNCSRWTVRLLVKDKTLTPVCIRGLKRFRRGDVLKLAEQGAA